MSNKSTAGAAAATSLVVANMIGTGVFGALGFQLVDFNGGLTILFLWVLGGLVAVCGALCYSELAKKLPRSGGEYHFLGAIYHPSLGFMAGMLSAVAGFGAPTALSALLLGGYLQQALPGVPVQASAVAVILIGTAAHGFSTRTSARVQVAATSLKLTLIVSFMLAAAILPGKGDIRWSYDPVIDNHQILSPQFATGFFWVLYSYSGWNAAVYGLEEWRGQGSTVRKALVIGALLVMFLYVGLNVAFLVAAPVQEMRGVPHFADIAAQSLLGKGAGRAISALFAVGLFSTVSALLWAGPRVLASMGRRQRVLSFFAPKDGKVPVRSLCFQSLFAIALVLLVNDIEKLLNYTQTALTLCTFLTVLGLLILRRREGSLISGRALTLGAAVAFLAVTGFVMVQMFFTLGWAPAVAGLATALAFALLWFPLSRFSQ